MRLSLVLPFLYCLRCLAGVIPAVDQNHLLKEVISTPRGWSNSGPVGENYVVELRIGIRQSNFTGLEQRLYEVSDPSHPNYGSYLTKEEVEGLIAPNDDSVKAVDKWLMSNGVDMRIVSHSPAKDWVMANIPVRVAEKMMNTTYNVWSHTSSGASIVRTLSYSLPESVHGHIDLIHPTTFFSAPGSNKASVPQTNSESALSSASNLPYLSKSGVQVDASCNTTVTVSCLMQLYNTGGVQPSAENGNRIGITGYLNEFANNQDLQQFFAEQRPTALNSTFEFTPVSGGTNSQDSTEAGNEANLDVQFALGLTYPTPSVFYSTAGSPPFNPDDLSSTNRNEPYLTWLDFMLNQTSLPQTITTSFADDEQTVPESYAIRVCNGFAQLGARGVSLLFSSGDGGVGDGNSDPKTSTCESNDGRGTTRFLPTFPASCPYVTSVGGTMNVPEIAADFSGGGFSNIFTRPAYQDDAVKEYLNTIPTGQYDGMYNPNGRAFPDVSAQSRHFRIIVGGQPNLVKGTSAATPTFAAIVSLLNDARLSQGLPPLGFLNPLLYSKAASALNDITVGNNAGCGTPGFNATKGWDAVTGLGTPDYGRLESVVLGL